MHPKKHGGASHSALPALSCVDAGNAHSSHVWIDPLSASLSARQAATPLGAARSRTWGDGVLVVPTRMGATAAHGLGRARHRPARYLEVGDL
jgi:hypothetical protein